MTNNFGFHGHRLAPLLINDTLKMMNDNTEPLLAAIMDIDDRLLKSLILSASDDEYAKAILRDMLLAPTEEANDGREDTWRFCSDGLRLMSKIWEVCRHCNDDFEITKNDEGDVCSWHPSKFPAAQLRF